MVHAEGNLMLSEKLVAKNQAVSRGVVINILDYMSKDQIFIHAH